MQNPFEYLGLIKRHSWNHQKIYGVLKISWVGGGDKSSLTRFIFRKKLGKDPLVLERKTKKSSEIYIYQSSKTRPHKTETEHRMIS